MITNILFDYILMFIAGLAVGSFLNVVIFRLENGWNMVSDRSRCLHCRHVLEWFDLIPVLSFILLMGKCRYCGKKISWQYPLVEIATGLMFVGIFNHMMSASFQFSIFTFQSVSNFPYAEFSFTPDFILSMLYYLLVTSALIVVFVYDFRNYIIPDEVIFVAIIAAFLYNFFIDNTLQYVTLQGLKDVYQFQAGGDFWIGFSNLIDFLFANSIFISHLFAAAAAFTFFFLIVFLTGGKGMGGGDVKLGFLMGFVVGWPMIAPAILISFILGSVFGIILIAVGKKHMKSMIAFGPFLVIGTFIAMFWGEEIVKWYFGYIN